LVDAAFVDVAGAFFGFTAALVIVGFFAVFAGAALVVLDVEAGFVF
jgi:hypothetical protein